MTHQSMKQPGVALLCLLLAFPFQGNKGVAQQAPRAHHASGGFTQPDPVDFSDHAGWTQIFDGKTLNGWDGSAEVWHVEDGALVAESSPEQSLGHDQHHLEGRPAGQLRTQAGDEARRLWSQWRHSVPQSNGPAGSRSADQVSKVEHEGLPGRLRLRQPVHGATLRAKQPTRHCRLARPDGRNQYWNPHRLLATLGSSDELKSYIKEGDWNQYEVIADGHTLIHIINGHVMAILVDNDPAFRQAKGLIAFEIEGGGL